MSDCIIFLGAFVAQKSSQDGPICQLLDGTEVKLEVRNMLSLEVRALQKLTNVARTFTMCDLMIHLLNELSW